MSKRLQHVYQCMNLISLYNEIRSNNSCLKSCIIQQSKRNTRILQRRHDSYLPMASSLKKLITSFLLFFFYTNIVASSEPSCRRYKSIISFGDSIADTGNYLHLSDVNHPPQAAFLPYGETFFSVPTGRNSDGRLIIDFIGT